VQKLITKEVLCEGGFMGIKGFIKYVELPTKIASVTPFMLGILFTLFRYQKLDTANLLIMFISMICFDMATTAINNYYDYKNELKHFKDNYDGNNPMFIFNISKKKGSFIILTLVAVAIFFGILLTVRTNLLVLAIGALCFFMGIIYTFGPVPISRTPFGEAFSGFFMGFFITFLTVYSSIYNEDFFGVYLNGYILTAKFDLLEGLIILLISMPLVTGIANIMLANNICDLEDDIKVNRFTLTYYIGREKALRLYRYIYYSAYVCMFLGVFTRVLPVSCIFALLTIIVINKNIDKLEKNPVKSETFVTAVQNFTLLGFTYILCILIGMILM
jgi:1,4-dihydroxy-2-naphthoate octaprenyltransferase